MIKEGLYRIWCGVNRLGDSGVHTLGDTSAFVNPAGQLLFKKLKCRQYPAIHTNYSCSNCTISN